MTAISTDDDREIDGTTTTVVPAQPPAPPFPAPSNDLDTLPIVVPEAEPDAQEAPRFVPGAGLIAEAEVAIEARRWRDALRVLDSIDSIGANSVHTDGLLAIAATHLHKNRIANEAVGRIRAHPQTAASHRHLAQVAIAKHQYLLADSESRAAIEKVEADPELSANPQDWANLAASYAGLGWFDEAGDCLDKAETLGASDSAKWLVGRSTNHWGMSKTLATVAGVFMFLVIGLLALAVAITVPFLMREFRMTQLDDRFAVLANDAWSDERWLRLAHAGGVLLTVILWSVATQLA